MSEFSTTRIADMQTAVAGNSHLAPAMLWLSNNTALSRISGLELYEAIANAVANGTFVITYGGNSIP